MATTTTELIENQRQAEAQIAGIRLLGETLTTDQTDGIEYDGDTMTWDELQDRIREEALEITVTRTVRIVLCTGGPHCEIVWPENRDPSIVCYGWFGTDRFERRLTTDETNGVINAYGEWGDLIEYA